VPLKLRTRFLKTEANYQENFDAEVSEASERKTRWGKKNDKLLFKMIRVLESRGLVSLDHLLSLKENKEAVKDRQMNLLANKANWIGPIRNLSKRIKTLCTQRPMSVRERKFLKKIIRRDYEGTEINYNKLLEEFPGKKQRFLESIVGSLKPNKS
jgi:hypothetical protein